MASYKRIPLNQINVDERYQRSLQKARVKKIVKGFDARQLGVLEISQRNGAGTYSVFDGQHRLAALRELGVKDAPCLVHKMSPEEEAELFVRLQQDRKRVTPVERFKAQRFHGHEEATEIADILYEQGFTVSDSAGPANIRAITAIEGVFRSQGPELLRDTLATIAMLWGGDERSTDGYFIVGLAEFLRGYQDRIGTEERAKLTAVSPVVVLRRALGPMSGGGAHARRTVVAAELRKISGVRGRPAKGTVAA